MGCETSRSDTAGPWDRNIAFFWLRLKREVGMDRWTFRQLRFLVPVLWFEKLSV